MADIIRALMRTHERGIVLEFRDHTGTQQKRMSKVRPPGKQGGVDSEERKIMTYQRN